MLRMALAFLILALVAAVFGFGGIAIASAGIAKLLFYLFLIVFPPRRLRSPAPHASLPANDLEDSTCKQEARGMEVRQNPVSCSCCRASLGLARTGGGPWPRNSQSQSRRTS